MLEPAAFLAERVDAYDAELTDLRRDIHAHPELSWQEHRTTELIADLGGDGKGSRVVALRGDMDALPVDDVTTDIWTSTVPGFAHACGHDVHTTALLGAGLALADLHRESPLPGGVRLLFQPAEEVMPGGALHLMSLGALDDVERIFALHCDPTVDVGRVGIRSGALTSAADLIDVHLSGTGGHTSRPHLTGDLVFALAKVTTELPVILSRRMDPRAGVSVVWGKVTAGQIHNVIPAHGSVGGTVRILDSDAWSEVEHVVREVVAEIIAPYGVTAAVDYTRGVPPVSNDEESHQILVESVREVLGERGAVVSAQSLGGEDFGWYQEQVAGSMFRLGVRTPGGPTYDLHQGDLRIDEQAVGVGARVLAAVAARTLSS